MKDESRPVGRVPRTAKCDLSTLPLRGLTFPTVGMGTPILSAFYFGSVEHYALLARHGQVIIDTGEHYERQSYRTRTSIIGPNGIQHLNVQIARDHGNKMPMRTLGLSYVESWPQQHVHAIRSAYGQAPWFIHFIDEIEDLLSRRYERLVDLDLATLRLGLKWLGLHVDVIVSDRYVEQTSVQGGFPEGADAPLLDLRTTFQPKKPLPGAVVGVASYPQVFSDRHGYAPRLSVIDLVCNHGPQAALLLRR